MEPPDGRLPWCEFPVIPSALLRSPAGGVYPGRLCIRQMPGSASERELAHSAGMTGNSQSSACHREAPSSRPPVLSRTEKRRKKVSQMRLTKPSLLDKIAKHVSKETRKKLKRNSHSGIGTEAEVPKWLKGLPWKGSRSLVAARGFKSLLLRCRLCRHRTLKIEDQTVQTTLKFLKEFQAYESTKQTVNG